MEKYGYTQNEKMTIKYLTISTLLLTACGMPNTENTYSYAGKPQSSYVPPAPEIKIKIPKYYYPE